VLAGVASIFAALCYAEFASLVPMAGSAYTYGYATLGELFAWIIGWDLVLEYALGAVTVAIGWSGYVVSFLHDIGIDIPAALSAARGTNLIEVPAALAATLQVREGWQVVSEALTGAISAAGTDPASLTQVTAIFNLPAVIIIALVSTLLVVGIKESANVNNVIVFIKVAVVLLFIIAAAHAIDPANWKPFMPPNTGVRGEFGWTGVMTGAGVVFFATSVDAVSTAQRRRIRNRTCRSASSDRYHLYRAASSCGIATGVMRTRTERPRPDRRRGGPRRARLDGVAHQDGRDRGAFERDPRDAARAIAHLLDHVP
jgi:APA family basic amino acid/polyamine antiporter